MNTTVDYFNHAMSFAWRPENDGQGPHHDSGDAGGQTSWGVTWISWKAWLLKHSLPANLENFFTTPKEDFLPFYRAEYWNSTGCNSLGIVGITMFDIAMMSGSYHAVKFLQHVVGSEPDGEFGPHTLACFQHTCPNIVNDKLLSARNAFYESLRSDVVFLKGWERRATDCHGLVSTMLDVVASGTLIPEMSRDQLLNTAGQSHHS